MLEPAGTYAESLSMLDSVAVLHGGQGSAADAVQGVAVLMRFARTFVSLTSPLGYLRRAGSSHALSGKALPRKCPRIYLLGLTGKAFDILRMSSRWTPTERN